jgi:hypothetical protein
MAKIGRGGKKSFLFREFSQNILFGTTSDRYGGWSGRIVKNAWGMEHSVRTTQPGVLYSTEFVNLAAAAAEAVCQGEVRDG